MQVETWKPIATWEGKYSVSDRGNVRNDVTGRLFAGKKDKDGYPRVQLQSFRFRNKQYLVHRLVAEAFLGPCPEGMTVNHLDGIKTHNEPRNLEYVTPLENIAHAVKNGLRASKKGTLNGQAKLTEADVLAIRTDNSLPAFGRNVRLAIQYGVVRRHIEALRAGKRWGYLRDGSVQ